MHKYNLTYLQTLSVVVGGVESLLFLSFLGNEVLKSCGYKQLPLGTSKVQCCSVQLDVFPATVLTMGLSLIDGFFHT